MTVDEIVAKLKAFSAKLYEDTDVLYCGGVVENLDALIAEIEASATPQVTPAKAAAAYREVEGEGGGVRYSTRRTRLLNSAEGWRRYATWLFQQTDKELKAGHLELSQMCEMTAAAYLNCAEKVGTILDEKEDTPA